MSPRSLIATFVLLGGAAARLDAQEQGSFQARSLVIPADTGQLGLFRQLQMGLEGHWSVAEGELAQIRFLETRDSLSPTSPVTRRWVIVINYLRN